MSKRNPLSAVALVLAWGVSTAAAQTTSTSGPDATSQEQSQNKTIRHVGTDAWPAPRPAADKTAKDETAKDQPAKAATTSTVKTDPLSLSGNSAAPSGSDKPKTDDDTAAQATDRPPAAASGAPSTGGSPPATPTSTAATTSTRLGTDADGRVKINAEQSSQIGAALRNHNARPIEGIDIAIKAGVAVPAAVRLSAVPLDLVAVLPQFRGYEYFTTRQDIVVVEPGSKKIVALIALKNTAAASKPARAKHQASTPGRAITARRSPTLRERDITTGAALREEPGVAIPPPGMILRETTITTGTRSRTYRTLEPADGSTVVIERAPTRRRFIDLDTD